MDKKTSKKVELCDIASVSKFYGKSVSTIWQWVSMGMIPKPVKYQNRVYWNKDELLKASDKVSFFAPKKMATRKELDPAGNVKLGLGKVNLADMEKSKEYHKVFHDLEGK